MTRLHRGLRVEHFPRIISTTAHAAFDKAADYFGIKVHTIPIDPYTRQINLKLVKRAMLVPHCEHLALY